MATPPNACKSKSSRPRSHQRGTNKAKWRKREERHYSRIQGCNEDALVKIKKNQNGQQPGTKGRDRKSKAEISNSKEERKLRISLKRVENPKKASKLVWPSLSVPADNTLQAKECVKNIIAASKQICRQRQDVLAQQLFSDPSTNCTQDIHIVGTSETCDSKKLAAPNRFAENLPNVSAWIRTAKIWTQKNKPVPSNLPKIVIEPNPAPAAKKMKDAATSPIPGGNSLEMLRPISSFNCVLAKHRSDRRVAQFLAEALVRPGCSLVGVRTMSNTKKELLGMLNKVSKSQTFVETGTTSDSSSLSEYLTARKTPSDSPFTLDCMNKSRSLKCFNFSPCSEICTHTRSASGSKECLSPPHDVSWFDEMLTADTNSTSRAEHDSTLSPLKAGPLLRMKSPSPLRVGTPPEFLYSKAYRF